ncbi:Mor transcription activator family protein [Massilia endophytica]|uniref:Mor transcription activator family protein n=1 Tax=Massilia endophytica TaxID=2899220 RepID=UPI001E2ADEB5|nr:Mor transcription activator family protein [Massilia endophytica]UGQ45089.1 helix-turn-helix domain-containing protein [Massilia endophytica]
MHEQQLDIVGAILAEMRATLGDAALDPKTERELEAKFRRAWGGQAVYVKKTGTDADARAEIIRARFNGRNREELQAELGCSRSQFYRLLKGS